jgi:hypothetical protein
MRLLVLGGTRFVGRLVLEATVAGTWEWMQREGVPKGRPGREPGLPVEIERALLSGG